MTETLVLIPARMASTRLPGKPLAEIAGVPMIVHVWRRATETGLGRVVVATDAPEIMEVVREAGGEAVATASHHQSGSDRIYEALQAVDPDRRISRIVNLQGDLPTIDASVVKACAALLDAPEVDIATAAAPISDPAERVDPNVVKVVGTPSGEPGGMRALYFTRATAPHGDGPLYHHIGLYAYRREALTRFVELPPSPLERRERLEQLRALEAGMRIDVALVDTVPLGVDTPADLEQARRIMGPSTH